MATVPSGPAVTSAELQCPVEKKPLDILAAARAAAAIDVTMPKKQRIILGKYEEGKVFVNSDDSGSAHRSGNNGTNVQLWKFLLDTLTDYRHR